MPDNLPEHVAETVEAIESLHAQHREQASRSESALETIKFFIGRPLVVAVIVILVAFWIIVNMELPANIRLDPAPFLFMQMLVALGALLITVLILSTQVRADRLAAHREKLVLQLAMQSERRSAKIVELIEELRRDLPNVRKRIDPEAQQLAEKVDVSVVVEALKEPEPDVI